MLAVLLRPLVFAAGLLLLLPPGWCCLLGNALPRRVAVAHAAKPKTACCGHCGSQHGKPSDSAPERVPGRDGKCPCGERLSTVPGHSVGVGLDLSLPVPVAGNLGEASPPMGAAHKPTAAWADPPPHHLLNCVWLC